MKVSKNIYKGGQITDLNEIKKLAEEKKSVVIAGAFGYWVKPAGWVMHWSLAMILRFKIFYAVKESEITEVEFETK